MQFLPNFLLDALMLGGLYCLLAIGLALAFGVTRIINFAHGEFVMLGAYAAVLLSRSFGLDPLLSMPIAALGAAVLGWLLFQVCLKRVLRAPAINQILLLFGIGLVLQNVALILFTADERSVTTAYSLAGTQMFGTNVSYGKAIGLGVSMVFTFALLGWLRISETGRAMRAVAQQRDAARLMGIDVDGIYRLSFVINAALGAATGCIVSFLLTVSPFMGFPLLVKSFAIVVLGGLGSIFGTLIAAFILAIAETGVAYYVPDGGGWADGIALAILLLVLVLRPRGIRGGAIDA